MDDSASVTNILTSFAMKSFRCVRHESVLAIQELVPSPSSGGRMVSVTVHKTLFKVSSSLYVIQITVSCCFVSFNLGLWVGGWEYTIH